MYSRRAHCSGGKGNQLGGASRRGGSGLGLGWVGFGCMGRSGAESEEGWGIDPTLHGLQTSGRVQRRTEAPPEKGTRLGPTV